MAGVIVPQAAPQLRFLRFRDALESAFSAVLNGGEYILGSQVEAFEAAFARYLGVRHCIAVNSGTDAIALALRALGVNIGAEVLTVALTAAGTATGILAAGAKPCFVDIDPATRCINLDDITAAITARTEAIVPVHLHGFPVAMPQLMEIASRHNLAVVEDCAQAHGARIAGRFAGSFGHASAFSFYPTKNLGCMGDGGAVVTDNPAIASRLRALRNHGWSDSQRISASAGCNSRLDEIQAAILNTLLRHLDDSNQERIAMAKEYREALCQIDEIDLPIDESGAVYHQFAIAIDRRDLIRGYLKDQAGVQTGIHFWPALHQQPAFQPFYSRPLHATETVSKRLISLPIQPEVAASRITMIVEALKKGIVACRKS